MNKHKSFTLLLICPECLVTYTSILSAGLYTQFLFLQTEEWVRIIFCSGIADVAQRDDIELNFQLNANCTFTIVCWPVLECMKVLCLFVGKKQDVWYVVDLLTGEKQQTLTSSYAEMLCPSSSLLYLGRTGKGYHLSLVLTLGETISVCVYMSRKSKIPLGVVVILIKIMNAVILLLESRHVTVLIIFFFYKSR